MKKVSLRSAATDSGASPMLSQVVIMLIFSPLLFLLGVFCVVDSLLPVDEPINLQDIHIEEMEVGNTYDLGEVMILDTYAESDDRSGNPIAYNMIVMFADGEGTTALGSLEFENTDGPWDQVSDYIGDIDQPIGSLVLPVCCSARTLSETNELYDWFMDDTAYYQELDEDFAQCSALVLDLAYETSDTDTYMEENSEIDYVTIALGLIIMVGLGLCGTILGIILLKRYRKSR